jgi:hypothetical protein
MLSQKTLISCSLCLFGAFAFGTSQLPVKPTPAPTGDPLPAILKEVQLIRASIPRSNLNTFMADTTMARIKMQKDIIDRLVIRLEETKAGLKKSQDESEEQRIIRKSLEERLNRSSDPVQRAGIEYAIEQLKYKVNSGFQYIQDLRNQEFRLNSQINSEQKYLDDYNNRLDKLLNELENQVGRQEK